MATKQISAVTIGNESNEWSGHTLDDIRYRRAINHVKMEIEKDKLVNEANQLVGSTTQGLFSSPVAKKMFSGFSYLDYGVLAFQVFRQIQKVYRLFRFRR